MSNAILDIPFVLRPRNIPGRIIRPEERNEYVRKNGLPSLSSKPARYYAKVMATEEFLGTRVALFLGMLSASGVEQADEAVKYLEMLDTANRKVQEEIGVVSTSIDDDFQRIHDYLKPSFNFEFTQNNFVVAWNSFYNNLLSGARNMVGNCFSSAVIFAMFAMARGWEIGERHGVDSVHSGVFAFSKSYRAGQENPKIIYYWHITEGQEGPWGPTIPNAMDGSMLASVFSLIPAAVIFDEFMDLTDRETSDREVRLESSLALNPFFTRGFSCLKFRCSELGKIVKAKDFEEKSRLLKKAINWDLHQKLSLFSQLAVISYPDQ